MTPRNAVRLLAIAGLIAGSAVRAEPGAVTLRLSPHEEAREYWIRTVEEQERRGPGMAPRHNETDRLELIVQASREVGDGMLQVALLEEATALSIDGQRLPPGFFEAAGTSVFMSDRGEFEVPPGEDPIPAAVFPVFPREPILPGHEWETRSRSTPGMPAQLRMEHRLDSIREVEGRPVAVIHSTGRARGLAPETGALFRLQVVSMVILDLRAGEILYSKVASRSAVKTPEPDAEGTQLIVRNRTRIVQPRAEDDLEYLGDFAAPGE